jgi:nucleotide-binding universal stress UspA family protein
MRPLMLHTVLAATDLSEDDLPSLATAMQLARLWGAHLHIIHAGRDDDETARQLERHIRAADPSADLLPGSTLREGPADRVIVEAARSMDVDLIVLGPHRREQSRSPGGTAYRVAATSERPCLVLPGAVQLPLSRILVPIDASGAARGALAVGMTWASALRRRQPQQQADATELVILHVENPAQPEDASAHEVIDEAVTAVAEHVAEVAGVRVRRASGEGDAAAAVLEHAKSDGADLIVIGTRGEIGTASELGSVASAIIRSTRCPLLLVPPRVWRELGEEPLP